MDKEIKYIYKMFLGSLKNGNLILYRNKFYYGWRDKAGFGFLTNSSKMVEEFATSSLSKFIEI